MRGAMIPQWLLVFALVATPSLGFFPPPWIPPVIIPPGSIPGMPSPSAPGSTPPGSTSQAAAYEKSGYYPPWWWGGNPGYSPPSPGGNPGYSPPPSGGNPGYSPPSSGGNPGYSPPPSGGNPGYSPPSSGGNNPPGSSAGGSPDNTPPPSPPASSPDNPPPASSAGGNNDNTGPVQYPPTNPQPSPTYQPPADLPPEITPGGGGAGGGGGGGGGGYGRPWWDWPGYYPGSSSGKNSRSLKEDTLSSLGNDLSSLWGNNPWSSSGNNPWSSGNNPWSSGNNPWSPGNRPGSSENKPGSSENKPGSSENKPGSSGNNPWSSGNNPWSSGNNPWSSGNNPWSSGNNPWSSGNNPWTSGNNPWSSGNNPWSSGNNPGASGNNPWSPGNRPGSTENKPGSSENKPGTSENKPGSSENKPGSSENKPGSSGNNPWSSGNNPWSSGNNPGASGNNPGASGNNPWSSGNNPGASGNNPWSSGNNPWLSGNNAWSSGNNPGASGNNPWSSGNNPWSSGNNPWSSGNNPWSSGNNPWSSGNNPWSSGNNPWSSGNNPWSSGGDNSGSSSNDRPGFLPPWLTPGDNPGSSSNDRPGFLPPWLSPGDNPGFLPPWLSPGDRPGSSPPESTPGKHPGFLHPGLIPGHRPGFIPGHRPGNTPPHRPGNTPPHRPGNTPGHRPGSRPPSRPVRVPTPNFDISVVDAADICIPEANCNENATYRTLDGSCNNLKFPMWGQSSTAYSRLVQAQYSDGVHALRLSVTGNPLPSPRKISTGAFLLRQIPAHVNSLMVMACGQLITHDGSNIPLPPTATSCCTNNREECSNIEVPDDDPFYEEFNVTCLPFQRTPTTASIGCPLKPEYTLTFGTHFIDASFVYSSNTTLLAGLRLGSGGLLRFQNISGQLFPPPADNPDVLCLRDDEGKATGVCMGTGDDRANQNPPLSSLQVIAFREHNRIATALSEINPQWDDDKLFEEARRILWAEWQLIVYRDYVPVVVGLEAARAANLIPKESGFSDDYDEFLNPSTTNDFTTAAFRVFHSQIPSAYCSKGGGVKVRGCPFGANNFSNSYNNPSILFEEGGLDSVLQGLEQQHASRVDNRFSVEVSGKLFRDDNPWGQDLIATDIQRGRDTGLPPYNTYRELCGSSAAKNWTDFLDVLEQSDIDKLESIYEDPDDVDLFVGGTLERRLPGSLVGPTYACIIVDQFKRWKQGDRYFFDLQGFKHSFTEAQLNAIRKASLSRWICDNSENITTVSVDTFLARSPQVSCDDIPVVDLSAWATSSSDEEVDN